MKVYFLYDSGGYLIGNTAAEAQPANSTEIAPEFRAGHWARFIGGAWSYEPRPASAADLEGMTVPDFVDDTVGGTTHDKEIYAAFQVYLDDDHKITHNGDGTVTFLAKTADDKERERAERDYEDLSAQIAEIRERLADAQLMGDAEWIAELRAAYKELIGG